MQIVIGILAGVALAAGVLGIVVSAARLANLPRGR